MILLFSLVNTCSTSKKGNVVVLFYVAIIVNMINYVKFRLYTLKVTLRFSITFFEVVSFRDIIYCCLLNEKKTLKKLGQRNWCKKKPFAYRVIYQDTV